MTAVAFKLIRLPGDAAAVSSDTECSCDGGVWHEDYFTQSRGHGTRVATCERCEGTGHALKCPLCEDTYAEPEHVWQVAMLDDDGAPSVAVTLCSAECAAAWADKAAAESDLIARRTRTQPLTALQGGK